MIVNRPLLLAALTVGLTAGPLPAEFITDFDPGAQPLYWVSGTYVAEAVRFDVGEASVSLDELRLHYDACDVVEVFIITTLPDTTPPSLIHRVGEISVPVRFVDSWMPVDLRSDDIRVAGEFWVYIRNLSLTEPPGISFRGANSKSSSLYHELDIGWNVSAGNFGVGVVVDEPVGIEDEDIPVRTPRGSLGQNHPNPFNPSTTLSFRISGEGEGGAGPVAVSLRVYDLRGRCVRSLIEGACAPGSYTVVWDGRDDRGGRVASGGYLSVLRTGTFTETRKMLLVE
jgi:hypothetical protein